MKFFLIWMVSVVGLGLFVCPAGIFDSLTGEAYAENSKTLAQGEQGWSQIYPEINMFWKEMEEAPFQAKKNAWRIIRLLKDFIVSYPDSSHIPEAYYLVGIAYKEVGFIPEAISHWRIVARGFPDSRWADEALMEIIIVYNERGDMEKKRRLLKEIIRQHYDTTSAKAAWIELAMESVIAGKNVDFIRREVKKLEDSDPELGAKVPIFYELKARIAQQEGKDRAAIDYWIHFLNLTPSRDKQALALYEIGEAYRRLGDLIKARKYYALCAKDFSRTSFSLFSRFRLAQTREVEKGLLPWASGERRDEESSMWLYQKILDTYPRHPITQEVIYEFARLKLRRRDPLGALDLVKFYLTTNPGGQLESKFLALSNDIQKDILIMVRDVDSMEKNLKACIGVVNDKRMVTVLPGFVDTTKRLWRQLINKYIDLNQYVTAIEEAVKMKNLFADDQESLKFSQVIRGMALGHYFQQLTSRKRPLELLDFFYSRQLLFQDVLSRVHYFYVAQAWDSLSCDSESSYYYGMAYGEPGTVPDDGKLLLAWGEKLALLGEKTSLERIISEYEGIYEQPTDPGYFHLRFVYEKMMSNWEKAYNYAASGLDHARDPSTRRTLLEDLIEGSSHLGLWDVAHHAYDELEEHLTEKERAAFLESWADLAVQLGNCDEAIFLYNLLLTTASDNSPARLKMAICLLRQGKTSEAKTVLRILSVDKDGFISKTATALLDDELFWENVPGDIFSKGR